jgi:hypothetical protein
MWSGVSGTGGKAQLIETMRGHYSSTPEPMAEAHSVEPCTPDRS